MKDKKEYLPEGPAFPIPLPSKSFPAGWEGMSLRDYFAAHAPECPKWFYEIKGDGTEIAQQRTLALWAYSYADAMLQRRKL